MHFKVVRPEFVKEIAALLLKRVIRALAPQAESLGWVSCTLLDAVHDRIDLTTKASEMETPLVCISS